MWLNSLQIAIIERDVDKLDKILEENSNLSDKKDIEKAMYLLKEAAELVYELKDDTATTMTQLKKNINFLRSTEVQMSNKLDIKS